MVTHESWLCVLVFVYYVLARQSLLKLRNFFPPSILVSYSYANILIMMRLLFSLQPIYKVLAISLKASWLLQQWVHSQESDLSNSRKFEKIANVYEASGLKVLFVITHNITQSIYVLQLVLLWNSISDFSRRQFFEACIWDARRALELYD